MDELSPRNILGRAHVFKRTFRKSVLIELLLIVLFHNGKTFPCLVFDIKDLADGIILCDLAILIEDAAAHSQEKQIFSQVIDHFFEANV